MSLSSKVLNRTDLKPYDVKSQDNEREDKKAITRRNQVLIQFLSSHDTLPNNG